MSRIVCVSHRVPADSARGIAGNGGLADGMREILESRGAGMWFGWDGNIIGSFRERQRKAATTTSAKGTVFATIPLTEKEHSDWRLETADKGLWPFLHEMPGHIAAGEPAFAGFRQVSYIFAAYLRPLLKPDDIVWVHDYHLMPLGQALRDLGVENKILYFHHVTLPDVEVVRDQTPPPFQALYDALIQNLFAYNRAGFQSFRDLHNFMDYIGYHGSMPKRYATAAMSYKGRRGKFGVFPVSIETASLEMQAKAAAGGKAPSLRKPPEDRALIIGADRLDYTKGLAQRMKGVDLFLSNHPDLREKTEYIQIVSPHAGCPRSSLAAKEAREAANDLNKSHRHGVLYSEDALDRNDLIGYFRQARVGLVTSLMDGQNLVAKEFLAAQNPDDPGILILSQHTGAAEELANLGALLVDPRDPGDIAAKIARALNMSIFERVKCHSYALEHLRVHDLNHWVSRFLDHDNISAGRRSVLSLPSFRQPEKSFPAAPAG
jgi:trehalose 6-phosphate synthase